ncbi:MAG TPA: biotin transporter BioY [Myxococcota bacterium]|nr:biotin transporter BioY [Myxococcota bacterium]HRY95718.1 biotin transporter BioY [Myxococcota bacterium]HSA21031.1 biotin transporter BioY [Myxococcota bacterium]
MSATTAIQDRAAAGRAGVWAREAGLVVGLAGLTALSAQVTIPLPWTPVPATLQVAAVVFAGAAFGPRRGLLSQLLYLLLGLTGLPVFAAVTGGATLGYLLAFPLAALLAGLWAGRLGRWLGAGLAVLAIHALGSLWLCGWALATDAPASGAWVLWAGSLPFLPFDALKAGLAVLSAAPLRHRFPAA